VIQQALKRLLKGRTSFVIAHRLSTITAADLIVVMDHGKIIESGSHHELLRRKGAYYHLYSMTYAA
ncbi:MAG: multidrug ABC transporter ATP-binding protein, partial [Bdellovibrio sp.]|nr:multidrug ABC transporter ATP-binding protein [Bdellovibrio sp.]